jgi:hypothetical protein
MTVDTGWESAIAGDAGRKAKDGAEPRTLRGFAVSESLRIEATASAKCSPAVVGVIAVWSSVVRTQPSRTEIALWTLGMALAVVVLLARMGMYARWVYGSRVETISTRHHHNGWLRIHLS